MASYPTGGVPPKRRVEEASPQRAQVLRLRFADYRARRGV
jgi:hypothetical protein